jgi:hypothetical protein
MVKLDEVTAELLLNIASFLSQVDLLNLSLTNKQLRYSTEPELYREYMNTGEAVNGRDLKPFLRRIIEAPKLTRYVHYLDLKHWTTLIGINPLFGKHDEKPLSVDEYEYFARAAKSAKAISTVRKYDVKNNILDRANALVDPTRIDEPIPGWADYLYEADAHIDQVPFDNKFCQLLQNGIGDALYFLLFTLLPNLRHVCIRGGPYHGQNLHLFPFLKPEHRFSGLQRLTVGAQDATLEWPLSSVGTMFQSQSLKTVECYMVSEWEKKEYEEPWEHRPPLTPLQPRSLNITRLMLQRAAFSFPGIKTLLAACQNLRSLYYSAGGSDIGPTNFTCEELIEALLPHKISLETLELDLFSEWDYGTHRPGCISDLSEFTALQSLLVTAEVVASPSPPQLCKIFPASLRLLEFQIYWSLDMQQQILEMMAMRPDKFESLDKITLTMDEPDSDSWNRRAAKAYEKTIRICKEAGVELKVATVDTNYERTLFEDWSMGQTWHDVYFKDDKYVREGKGPKTLEEMKRDMVLEGIPTGTCHSFRCIVLC